MRTPIVERDEWADRVCELRAATRGGVLGCDSAYLVLEGEAPFHWVVAPAERGGRNATLCGRPVGDDWLLQPEATTSPFVSESSFCGYPVIEELCPACMERMARLARSLADQLGRA